LIVSEEVFRPTTSQRYTT